MQQINRVYCWLFVYVLMLFSVQRQNGRAEVKREPSPSHLETVWVEHTHTHTHRIPAHLIISREWVSAYCNCNNKANWLSRVYSVYCSIFVCTSMRICYQHVLGFNLKSKKNSSLVYILCYHSIRLLYLCIWPYDISVYLFGNEICEMFMWMYVICHVLSFCCTYNIFVRMHCAQMKMWIH